MNGNVSTDTRNTRLMTYLAVTVFSIVIFLIGAGMYNNLATKKEYATQQWAKVQSQYQRRADLIPNLVETVKGYTKHEETVLTEVTRLRSQWGEAVKSGNISKVQQAAVGIDSAMARLMVVMENYPNLKASEHYLKLHDSIEGSENRIAVARNDYNAAVGGYNTALVRFPNNVFKSFSGLDPMPYFEAKAGAENAPQVKF